MDLVCLPYIIKESLMNADKNLQTEKITPSLIQYIVNKIVSEIQPEKIILFGSFARGDYSSDSDLDLFIVAPESAGPNRLIRRKIDALLWGRRFPIDLIVRKEKEIKWNIKAKNSFYTNNIFKDGRVLYAKES
jgi:predicted nucleotidyltransferase